MHYCFSIGSWTSDEYEHSEVVSSGMKAHAYDIDRHSRTNATGVTPIVLNIYNLMPIIPFKQKLLVTKTIYSQLSSLVTCSAHLPVSIAGAYIASPRQINDYCKETGRRSLRSSSIVVNDIYKHFRTHVPSHMPEYGVLDVRHVTRSDMFIDRESYIGEIVSDTYGVCITNASVSPKAISEHGLVWSMAYFCTDDVWALILNNINKSLFYSGAMSDVVQRGES